MQEMLKILKKTEESIESLKEDTRSLKENGQSTKEELSKKIEDSQKDSQKTVSYTHLDVYKRQGICNV